MKVSLKQRQISNLRKLSIVCLLVALLPACGGESNNSSDTPSKSDRGMASLVGGEILVLNEHCDYGGWAASFGEGEYDAAAIDAAGGKANEASSLKIRPGYKVTFHAGDHFTGESMTKYEDDACMDCTSGWNDRIQSFRVQKSNRN